MEVPQGQRDGISGTRGQPRVNKGPPVLPRAQETIPLSYVGSRRSASDCDPAGHASRRIVGSIINPPSMHKPRSAVRGSYECAPGDPSESSGHNAVSLPLPSRNTGDVQTKHGQGPEHDHSSDRVNPRPHVWSEDDCQRPRPEVECKLDGDARHNHMEGAANGENDELQRASLRRVLRLLRLLSGALSSAAGWADAAHDSSPRAARAFCDRHSVSF
jgi:hypothetical protein